ncbi:RHS repeat domain-containing protein [Chromobacterium phragmitis]|uniref:RHS repeat domain-containing protein n=1 Tax=Chromobacterium phragmitis TaxID=2202141 RepID=UPI0018E0B75F|nr:RHS repeat-associated core domain-containing protein [Chromobacterium phragmitis]
MLAFETRDEKAVHYLFEPDSFVPLAQVHTDAIRGVKVPAWSQHNPYDPDKDPLRQPSPEPEAPKAVYYYHTDHLGTPQALTDEQGALALEMDYKAWGQAREVIADAAGKAGIRNPFRFQGQYHDDESGLHYNRHRYYDPEIGRFISKDIIGLAGGINLYQYANNPLKWIDPLGLAGTTIDGLGNVVPTDDYGIPDRNLFQPNPNITKPYVRDKTLGPVTSQQNIVQGQPCVVCGNIGKTQVADHVDPLAVEYYRTGKNDVTHQTSTASVQAHCLKCSSKQGGRASAFTRAMKKKLGI